MLTIVDDFTRFVWAFLIAHKSLICNTFKHLFAMIQTHFNKSVKFFRLDNGSKFVNQYCLALFGSLGIVHQRTCPYTPQ